MTDQEALEATLESLVETRRRFNVALVNCTALVRRLAREGDEEALRAIVALEEAQTSMVAEGVAAAGLLAEVESGSL